MICVTRNKLSGGYVVFSNFELEQLENGLWIYGVQIENGETFNGNFTPKIRKCVMLDFEREVYLKLWKDRFERTDEFQESFSFHLRAW